MMAGPDALPEVTPAHRSFIAAAKEGLAFAAVAGGAFYAMARLVLVRFYAQFDLEPEEVGWNTSAVLSRFALPWIVLVVLGTFVIIVAFRERTVLWRGAVSLASWNIYGPIVIFTVVVAVLACPFILLIEDYARTSERIRAGQAAVSGSGLDLFPIVASCVTASTQDGSAAATSDLTADESLTFMGEAAGRVVLWDSMSEATYRIPSPTVALTGAECGQGSDLHAYRLRRVLLVAFLCVVVLAALLLLWRSVSRKWLPGTMLRARRLLIDAPLKSICSHHVVPAGDKVPIVNSILEFYEHCRFIKIDSVETSTNALRLELRPSSWYSPKSLYGRMTVEIYEDEPIMVIDQQMAIFGFNPRFVGLLPGVVGTGLVYVLELVNSRPLRELRPVSLEELALDHLSDGQVT
jgi:hypothetical protein